MLAEGVGLRGPSYDSGPKGADCHDILYAQLEQVSSYLFLLQIFVFEHYIT